MTSPLSDGRGGERGYVLLGLMAALAIMLTSMAVGARGWRYLDKNDREEEFLFRAGQIANAIQAYQNRHANAAPPSLDVLVEGKFLRKAYVDPLSESGEWKLIHQGDAVGPVRAPGTNGAPAATPSPTPAQRPTGAGRPDGQRLGAGIIGVASRSTDKSLRLFNGADSYDQWVYLAGQTPVIGRQVLPPAAPQQPTPLTAPGVGAPGARPQGAATPLRTLPTPRGR